MKIKEVVRIIHYPKKRVDYCLKNYNVKSIPADRKRGNPTLIPCGLRLAIYLSSKRFFTEKNIFELIAGMVKFVVISAVIKEGI